MRGDERDEKMEPGIQRVNTWCFMENTSHPELCPKLRSFFLFLYVKLKSKAVFCDCVMF